mmetsp:Transcript_94143/g.210459  ORF Transcript_94143/g.210459 Transcript_94143/m.210459 type:complete len:206 (+) Transcript_94143:179-796(+)
MAPPLVTLASMLLLLLWTALCPCTAASVPPASTPAPPLLPLALGRECILGARRWLALLKDRHLRCRRHGCRGRRARRPRPRRRLPRPSACMRSPRPVVGRRPSGRATAGRRAPHGRAPRSLSLRRLTVLPRLGVRCRRRRGGAHLLQTLSCRCCSLLLVPLLNAGGDLRVRVLKGSLQELAEEPPVGLIGAACHEVQLPAPGWRG